MKLICDRWAKVRRLDPNRSMLDRNISYNSHHRTYSWLCKKKINKEIPSSYKSIKGNQMLNIWNITS